MQISHRLLRIIFTSFLTSSILVTAVCGQATDTIQIHSVIPQQIPNKIANQVEVYVSILNADGSPVKEITSDQLQILEDGQSVEIDQMIVAPAIPLNLVLALDTSGSMMGPAITQAKKAASEFITSLSPEDSLALIEFNHKVNIVTDFSIDHNDTLNRLKPIDSIPNTGTCLYDALFQSVQLMSQSQPGRRAIMVLTDGKDELLYGNPCSTAKVDDVINAAITQNTPIYVIGLGNQVDQKALGRISLLTGGEYLYSPDPNRLTTLFSLIFDHLRYQYYLRYTSLSAPGVHSLSIKVILDKKSFQDSKDFITPEFIPVINISNPLSGSTLPLPFEITTTISGQKEQIASVQFDASGSPIGVDTSEPFIMAVPQSSLPVGPAEFKVTAFDKAGNILSTASTTIIISAAPIITPVSNDPPTVITQNVEQGQDSESTPEKNKLIPWAIGGIALAVLLTTVILISLKQRKGRHNFSSSANQADATMVIDNNLRFDDQSTQVFSSSPDEEKTFIIILYSDDALRIGEQTEIIETPFTLGRAIDNHLIFPKDHPVSRHHAVINRSDDDYILEEVLSHNQDASTPKYPSYGTCINGKKLIPGEKIALQTGDEIQLGPRLKLTFKHNKRSESLSDVTMDDFRMP